MHQVTRSADCASPENILGLAHAVRFADGQGISWGEGPPRFTFLVPSAEYWNWLRRASGYAAAVAFVQGEFSVEGDVVAAVHYKLGQARTWRDGVRAALARGSLRQLRFQLESQLESWFQSRRRAARNIRFHYERSNDFYRQFLDARMVYSCAWYRRESDSLDQAQEAKLDLICRKLDLGPGEAFLDIGCGWGGLAIRAAERYAAVVDGCTLSAQQTEYARRQAGECGVEGRVRIHRRDFRDMRGCFDKIASVGMFEHVGRRRLGQYFRHAHHLLAPGGLLLNHGIIRPQRVRGGGAESLFLRRFIFPGGELAHLSDVIRIAEESGFEVLDDENLRPHYARTCRAWVERLQLRAEACLRSVDAATHRAWVLYLAASARSFEAGATEIHQLLLAKRGAPRRLPLSREYMYAPRGAARPEAPGCRARERNGYGHAADSSH